jgi:16S rRNA (cytidine1402-2'-O)-methyltransferase
VATPIGNLGDMSFRALDALRGVDLIACEDTRVTGKLLAAFGIATAMIPYHEHNAERTRPRLLAKLAQGARLALVSDAGTPLISDPGYKLVRAAAAAGIAVSIVPGASAVLAALALSGLPTDRFLFAGFLPAKSAQRRKALAELRPIAATLVFFETAPRLAATLADAAAILGPRAIAVCRELTKLHEEVRRARLDELARAYAGGAETRGEFVIVVAPPAEAPAADTDVDALLRGALARVSVKDAVGEVALATGRPRREVYQRALALNKAGNDAR